VRAELPVRSACSENCAQALAKTDRAIDLIVERDTKIARSTVIIFYVSGVILVVFAFYAHWRSPQLRLGNLLAGLFGAAFVGFGAMYQRSLRKKL
jgi:drug/metabolite transporter (DMT)-like permease